MNKKPTFIFYFLVISVYVLLLIWVDKTGLIGVIAISFATVALYLLRNFNHQLNLKIAIAYQFVLCIGNILVFYSLFDSFTIAIAISAAIFIPTFQLVKSLKT